MSDTTDLPFVRSSERGSFKNCPRQWYWSYVEQIVPISTELGAREFGTGWHLAMAEHYIPGKNRGRPLLETWEEWCEETRKTLTLTEKDRKKWNDGGKEAFLEMAEMGRFMLREYMAEYGEHVNGEYVADPTWEIICREETFAANIDNKAINVGTIDLVIRNENEEIWIVDHKTGKGFPNEASYNLDDQGGSYAAIATTILRHKKLIGQKERVKGIVFSFARKATEDKRPRNPMGLYTNQPLKAHYVGQLLDLYLSTGDAADFADDKGISVEEELANERARLSKMKVDELKAEAEDLGLVVYGEPSKVQPTPIFKRYEIRRTSKEQKHQLQRVVDDVLVMDMARKGQIPVLKAPGKLCPYCDFFQLCQLEEARGDVDSMISTLFKHRDPYHDHRDGAENSKLSVAADLNLKR